MFEALYKCQVLVGLEQLPIAAEKFMELFHVTSLDARNNLEVWGEGLLEFRLSKHLSVWNLTHK